MSLERITGQRVVDELKAGRMVYMLQLTDITSLTIADWLLGEFAIEEQPADPESPPPIRTRRSSRRSGRSWTGERSRPCTVPDGATRRSRTRWVRQ